MNVSKANVLTLQGLQELHYERSKIWANFFTTITEKEQHDEISLDDIASIFQQDSSADKEENDLASLEDTDVDDKNIDMDLLRDITNCSRFIKVSKSDWMNELNLSGCLGGEEKEMLDLFNETMPIVNECNRQFKEAGLEHILNTFDVKKIEEKVGSWLKNNSVQCNSQTSKQNFNTQSDQYARSYNYSNKKHQCRSCSIVTNSNDNYNSSDTLHSDDIARYIRSSRRSIKKKHNLNSKTIIKNYRLMNNNKQHNESEETTNVCDYYNQIPHFKCLCYTEPRYFTQSKHYCNYSKGFSYNQNTPNVLLHNTNDRRKIFRHTRQCGNERNDSITTSNSDSEVVDCICHRKGRCLKRHYTISYSRFVDNKSHTGHHKTCINEMCTTMQQLIRKSTLKHIPYKGSMLCQHLKQNYDSSDEKYSSDMFKISKSLANKKRKVFRKWSSSNNQSIDNNKEIGNYNDDEIKRYRLEKIPKALKKTSNFSEQNGNSSSDEEYQNQMQIPIDLSKQTNKNTIYYDQNRRETPTKILRKSLLKRQLKRQNATDDSITDDINKYTTPIKLWKPTPNKKKIDSMRIGQGSKKSSLSSFKCVSNSTVNQKSDQLSDIEFNTLMYSTIVNSSYESKNKDKTILSKRLKGKNRKESKHLSNVIVTSTINSSESDDAGFPEDYSESETMTISNKKNMKKQNRIDCSIVTSTTGTLSQQSSKNDEQQIPHINNRRGILVYNPVMRYSIPSNSLTTDGFFHITKEHLSSIIGERAAEKFLKYYIGRRRFNSNSTIYFKPPMKGVLNKNDSSSDSDDDLDHVGEYGDLYESLG